MKFHWGRRIFVYLGVMLPRDFEGKCKSFSVGQLKKLHKIKSMAMGSALQGVGLTGSFAFVYPPFLLSALMNTRQWVVARRCRGIVEAAGQEKGVNFRKEIGRKRYYLAGALLKVALFSLSLGHEDYVRFFDSAAETLVDMVGGADTAHAIGHAVASVVGELCPGADTSQVAHAIGGEVLHQVDSLVDSMQQGLGEALGYGNDTLDHVRNMFQYPESTILQHGLDLNPNVNLSWLQADQNLVSQGPQLVALEVGARALIGEANVLPMLAEEVFTSCAAASWGESIRPGNTASYANQGGPVSGAVPRQGPYYAPPFANHGNVYVV